MMRTTPILATLLLAGATATAAAQTTTPAAVPPEEIGSWRLSCVQDRMTDRADCQLRHREPIERAQSAAGSSLLLEVQDRGGRLVPVVVARELTLEAAGRGLLALTGSAQIRFPPNRYYEFPCTLEGRNLVCAPRAEDAPRAAEELANAQGVLVRMVGYGAGSGETVELRLDRTREALTRYRARVPEGTAAAPLPPAGGLTLPELLGRVQRLFGN